MVVVLLDPGGDASAGLGFRGEVLETARSSNSSVECQDSMTALSSADPGRSIDWRTPQRAQAARNVPAVYSALDPLAALNPAGVDASVGSVGDAYDNALAETTIGLYKTEQINRGGPWRNLDHVEIATLEWVDWYNHRRPHEAIDDFTPVAVEDLHYAHITALTEAGVSTT